MKFRLAIIVTALLTIGAISAAKTNASTTSYRSWASWYGPGLYGNTMACGGRLTTRTWGVANKTLRCGTRLRMCYRRCVTVTVVDRGPYVWGREFDLTYPVKAAIGMPSLGVVRWYITK